MVAVPPPRSVPKSVSRASLSRLENAEVSPTASVLGRLCAAYGLTMSRLMRGMSKASSEPPW